MVSATLFPIRRDKERLSLVDRVRSSIHRQLIWCKSIFLDTLMTQRCPLSQTSAHAGCSLLFRNTDQHQLRKAFNLCTYLSL